MSEPQNAPFCFLAFRDVRDNAEQVGGSVAALTCGPAPRLYPAYRTVGAEDAAGTPTAELYREPAERRLAADFLQARQAIEELTGSRQYREAMGMIASIAPSLDRFFVEVLVNTPEEDLRRNRLALLASIQREFTKLADFSEIVVEK